MPALSRKVFNQMKKDRQHPTITALSILIDAYCAVIILCYYRTA